ncbi:TLC domain-containing protein [Xylariaceae sp. FL0662B]|nr:TLC domain-containing protein [Xylariaceae sp. FL0662B]
MEHKPILLNGASKVPSTQPSQPSQPSRPAQPAQPAQLVRPQTASIKVWSKAREGDDSPLEDLTRWLLENQVGVSFNLLALLFLTHSFLPKARPITSKFFTLSYYNPNTGKYAAGHDDFYFISFCVVLLTGLRAGSMNYLLSPLARFWGLPEKKGARFAEQGWQLIYYLAIWPLGMYIYYRSPYFLNMQELWTDWPQRELGRLVKGYILVQWSLWLQQVLVLNMEARRKDYWQMLTHHILTITLMALSYAYHQTRVGHLILVTMDPADIALPLAKCLKYLGFTVVTDVIFGAFAILWLITRHVFYLIICWSLYSDLPRLIPEACYKGTADSLEGPFDVPNDSWSHLLDPFIDTAGTVCFNNNITFGFLSFLLTLQGLMIIWSVFLMKVIVRVLKGYAAEDIRSDEEASEDGEEDEELNGVLGEKPLAEEVGVEGINLNGRLNGRKHRNAGRAANSTGATVPGQSERKEILNRIGCDKKIN